MNLFEDMLAKSKQAAEIEQPAEQQKTAKPNLFDNLLKKSTAEPAQVEEDKEYALKQLMQTEEMTPEQEAEAASKIEAESVDEATDDLPDEVRQLPKYEELRDKWGTYASKQEIDDDAAALLSNLKGLENRTYVADFIAANEGYHSSAGTDVEGEGKKTYGFGEHEEGAAAGEDTSKYASEQSAYDSLVDKVESDNSYTKWKEQLPDYNDKIEAALTSHAWQVGDANDTAKLIADGKLEEAIQLMWSSAVRTAENNPGLETGVLNRKLREINLLLEGLEDLGTEVETEVGEPQPATDDFDISQLLGGSGGPVDPIKQMQAGTYVDPGVISGERPVSQLREIPRDTEEELADSDVVTIGELQRMMKRHGVSKDQLSKVKSMARYFGAEVPGAYDRMEEAKGKWSDIMLLGLPQKLTIVSEEDEALAEMYDELRSIALERKSTGEQLGELGLGMLAPQMLAARGIKSMMAIGFGTGAIAGAANSRSGEELQQALIGGGLGLALVGVGYGVSKYAFRRGRVPKQVMEEAEEFGEDLRKLPQEKKIEMAEQMDEVWKSSRNQDKSARMDEYLTRTVTNAEKLKKSPDNIIPTYEQFKLDNGLRKPPKLVTKKVAVDAAEDIEDYVIEIPGEIKYYVRRPSKESKEWSVGLMQDNGQVDWAENYSRLTDVKSYIFEKHSRPVKKVDFLRQLTDEQVEMVREQGAGLLPKYLKDEDPAVWLAYNNHVGEIGRLKKWLGTKTDKEFLDELAQQDAPFILDQYRRSVESDHLRKYLEREQLVGVDEWSAFRKVVVGNTIDVKYLARQFDDKFGSEFELIIDNISQKSNQISYVRAAALRRVARLRKLMQKSGLSHDEVYTYLDTGKIPGNLWERAQVTYKGEAVNILDEWKLLFEDLRQEANAMGLPISKVKNYVPRQRSGTVEYVRKLDAKLRTAETEVGVDLYKVDLTGASFKEAVQSSEAATQLVKEMKSVLGQAPESTAEFRRLFDILTDPNDIQVRRITQARAAIQRTGEELPDWVREKNLFQLVKDWTSNTFRHAALRDDLADMDQFRKFAMNQGDSWTATYVDNLQRDIVGTRSDTVGRGMMKQAQLTEIKLNRMADKLEQQGRDILSKGVRSLTYVPETYQMIAQSIYPNLLGGSIRASLQNILSAPVMSAPELGVTYGSYLSTRGMQQTLTRKPVKIEITGDIASTLRNKLGLKDANMSPRKLRQLEKLEEAGILSRTDAGWQVNIGTELVTRDADIILGAQGILPAQWTGELSAQLRSELKRSSTYHFAAGVYEKWTTMSMAMFEASERMARMQTYHIADQVATDLIGGQKNAAKWFSDISSSAYKRRIQQAMDLGDDTQVRQLVQRYFQSTNMFNYDRANMSALGRLLGPLFSTFTKWPMAMGGRVAHELYNRGPAGVRKLGMQLIAPFMAASVVNNLMDSPDEDPRIRVIFGSRGLTSLTPLSSFTSFMTGEFATPPIVQQVQAVADAVAVPDEKTPQRLSNTIQNSASIFMPGYNVIRIVGEDLPQLMGVNVRKRARGVYRGKGKTERQLKEAARLLK